jgi:hypothetical protein
MGRQANPIYVRIPDDLLKRIEQVRDTQIARPSMTETIRVLVERGLNDLERERK